MITSIPNSRSLLLAGAVSLGLGVTAFAQQAAQPATPPAATPAAPPPWAEGRPDAAIGAQLAPIAPPPIPTAADKLPVDKLKLPKGFKIEVYAAGVGNARTVRQGDKGTVFVGSRLLDKVYAIVDKGGKREVKTLYSGLYRPNGLAFKSGTLYIADRRARHTTDRRHGLEAAQARGRVHVGLRPDRTRRRRLAARPV